MALAQNLTWSSSPGDDLADTIRDALRQAGPTGLTWTEISDALGANYTAEDIDRALGFLKSYGRRQNGARHSHAGTPNGALVRH